VSKELVYKVVNIPNFANERASFVPKLENVVALLSKFFKVVGI
jgi:hypothetical protein